MYPDPHSKPRARYLHQWRTPSSTRTPLRLPLALYTIEAGFPTPVESELDGELDLNDLLIDHPNATFFVRVRGDSMRGAGIHHGDLLIVDRACTPQSGQVVVAVLHGEFTVKRWQVTETGGLLTAENPHFSPIEIHPHHDFMIWGVVRYVIHRP